MSDLSLSKEYLLQDIFLLEDNGSNTPTFKEANAGSHLEVLHRTRKTHTSVQFSVLDYREKQLFLSSPLHHFLPSLNIYLLPFSMRATRY